MSVTGLLSIFLAAILTNNYVLYKCIGCPGAEFCADVQKEGGCDNK